MARISKTGLDFIKSFESFVPYVYDDKRAPVKGKYPEWKGGAVRGTLTIGYGHTNAAKHPLKIDKGLRISEAEGCDILDVDLDECEADVNRLVTVPISQGQFDALASFTFNCGAGNLKKLIVPLNRNDYAGTRARFDLYVKSKGEFMRGLQRRRDGEQAMWDANDAVLPTEPVPHPAEVDAPSGPVLLPEPKGMVETATKSPTVNIGIGGIVMLIVGYIMDGFSYLFNALLSLLDFAPESIGAVAPIMAQSEQLAGWLNIPWGKISMVVVVGLLVVIVIRHLRDVRWLDKSGKESA